MADIYWKVVFALCGILVFLHWRDGARRWREEGPPRYY